jgi:hypothetical protein
MSFAVYSGTIRIHIIMECNVQGGWDKLICRSANTIFVFERQNDSIRNPAPIHEKFEKPHQIAAGQLIGTERNSL